MPDLELVDLDPLPQRFDFFEIHLVFLCDLLDRSAELQLLYRVRDSFIIEGIDLSFCQFRRSFPGDYSSWDDFSVFVIIDVSYDIIDLSLVEVADHGKSSDKVAIERSVSHSQFRLVGIVDDHASDIIRDIHEDHSSDPRLEILVGYAFRLLSEFFLSESFEAFEHFLDLSYL